MIARRTLLTLVLMAGLATARCAFAAGHAPRISWRASTPASGDWVLGLAIGTDGTVYARTWAGTTVVGFAPGGTVRRTLDVGSPVRAMVAARDGTIYVASEDNVVRRFAADDHPPTRTFTSEDTVVALATTSDGRVYAASSRGDIYAIDPGGSVRWKYVTNHPLHGLTVDHDGLIRAGLGDGVYVFTPDGQLRGKLPRPMLRLQSIAAILMPRDDIAYVTTRERHIVYALDLARGTMKWSFITSGTPFALTQSTDGTIYVGSFDGTVYAVDPERGTLRWRVTAGAGQWGTHPVHALAVGKDGTIYAGAGASVVAIAPAVGLSTGSRRARPRPHDRLQ